MRSLGAVVLAVLVSGFIADIVQLELGVAFNAQEEFVAVMMGQVLFVLALSAGMLIAVLAFGTERAVSVAAIAAAAVIVALVVFVELFTLTTDGVPIPDTAAVVARDGPILLEVVVPALLAALIQWWMLRRHVRKAARAAAAA